MSEFHLVLRPADEALAVVLTGEDDVEGGGGDGALLTEHLSWPALELPWRRHSCHSQREGGGRGALQVRQSHR